jgi:hypothetical protein
VRGEVVHHDKAVGSRLQGRQQHLLNNDQEYLGVACTAGVVEARKAAAQTMAKPMPVSTQIDNFRRWRASTPPAASRSVSHMRCAARPAMLIFSNSPGHGRDEGY